MKSHGLPVIARKEFSDHLRSKKFLLIFGIFLIITIIGMVCGAANYLEDLQDYNEEQSVAENDILRASFGWGKPSIMTIYHAVSSLIITIGAILGVAMGFDLISKEKETKSLKILLSHPIYRDEVINGKALGGLMAIAAALGITFIVTFAILLISGIVPTGDELIKILVFGGAVFLMILSYFALSLFMSTVTDESGKALVYTIIVFVTLMTLPTLVSGPVMDLMIGEPPEFPFEAYKTDACAVDTEETSCSITFEKDAFDEPNPLWKEYEREMDEYSNKRRIISDAVTLISPTMNLERISSRVLIPDRDDMLFSGVYVSDFIDPQTDWWETIINNIIALLAFPAFFLGLAYVRFMRMDIR